jgi:micrococcal nuclease
LPEDRILQAALARKRFEPRRSFSIVIAIGLVALVGLRLWQSSQDDRGPETLDAGLVTVRQVFDGDTLQLEDGARVRLLGVDSPETKYSRRSDGADQPVARDALLFTEKAVEGRQVRLQFDKERADKYGRFLAYVWFVDIESGEERLLNEELLRAGLGRALLNHPYAETMKRRFRAAQQEARETRRGIWAQELAPADRR